MHEEVAVLSGWAAVDFEDRRILLPRVEVRGFQNPALSIVADGALEPHFLDLPELY